MVKEVTYYDIICDRCGKSLIKESETCYSDKDSALMVAEQSEWQKISGKHYCPDCYKLDEVMDEYIPKKGGEEMSKTILCGECEKFLYEDIEGYGFCGKTKEVCYCGDKCHLINGKP